MALLPLSLLLPSLELCLLCLLLIPLLMSFCNRNSHSPGRCRLTGSRGERPC